MQTSVTMPVKMNTKEIQQGNGPAPMKQYCERCFKLTLHASVQGTNAVGENFREQTRITSISAEKAVFFLKSPVTIGCRLTLSLQIPKTLVLESAKNLLITGLVSQVKADDSKNIQMIALRLNRNFKILSMS
jgi:hypothetical protein